MNIQILIDNTGNPERPQLTAEHGLSMLIEFQGKRLLCDMGLAAAFWKNADQMDIDLRNLDYAFVSHGHKDHSGGLMTFLEHNTTTPVYLSPAVFHRHFFTLRHTEKRDISTDERLLDLFASRLNFVDGNEWLTPDIAMVKCDEHTWPSPVGNAFLTTQEEGRAEQADDFCHELSLAFKTEKGLVIVSSCSHNGALNIIQSCKKFTGEERVHAFVGGLHFVDCNRTAQEVAAFQEAWNRLYPDTLLYTGHCTSDKAKRALQPVLSHLHIFYTGESITL